MLFRGPANNFYKGPRKMKRSGILWGEGETTERSEKWPVWNKGHFELSAVRFDAIRGAFSEKADFNLPAPCGREGFPIKNLLFSN